MPTVRMVRHPGVCRGLAVCASSQHAEHTSGGWLCHYPIRRPNGTLLKLCENPVSAEGVLCHQHRS